MHRNTFTAGLLLAGGAFGLPGLSLADFAKDSKASLELRNFYMNRDFRQRGATQAKAEEWAQGFLLRYESGFSEGRIGVGVDALGLLGVKLDSGAQRSGTQLLKQDRETRRAQDEYAELGLTAKLKASRTLLKLGTLQPRLPSVAYNDGRLLPQTFRGGHLSSQEIDGLTLDAGRLTQVNQRSSSDYEDMTVSNGSAGGIGVKSSKTSDAFNFAGLTYQWSSQLATAYHYGELEDLYRQHILNLTHSLALSPQQSLRTELRAARANDAGSSNVDNDAYGAMLTYRFAAHSLGVAYQRMAGDTGYAYIAGSDPFLFNYVQFGDFANRDERSWQLRYDYDFAAMGIPGLTFMTRYITGDGIELGAGKANGKEWERNTDIAYVFQSGALKNLGVKWRNATVRTRHFGNDLDDNRLILSYTLPVW
ncbi:OprD family porin [Pseudomonas sp. BN606]|uniref:OprD family porin n=1 Tax=Pseudomonas sp. BN606 TaxID=2567894 RepID=UPI002453D993|nr:OprD family porin [Pseudomonas sp. BN606]MDH4653855.1 OprD family porin [Pseudomonas sp. BN606]